MTIERATRIIFILAIGCLYTTFLTTLLVFLPNDTNKHILSLVISLVSFSCYSIKNDLIKSGIGLGSTLQLVITLGYHWSLYDDLLKIGLYGVALLSLILITHYCEKSDSNIINDITGFALASVYSVFFFIFITYYTDYIHSNEFHKRLLLTTVSTLTIVVFTVFGNQRKMTTRFGCALGLGPTFWYADSPVSIMITLPYFTNISIVIGLSIGISYYIVLTSLVNIANVDYESSQFLLLALSILTLCITTRMTPSLSKYGLLVGSLMILIVTSVTNFNFYSPAVITMLAGIALAILLYFASSIETNN